MAKLNGKDIIGIITKGRLVKLQKKTVTPTASAQTIKPDAGYDGMSEVTINKYIINSQTKTATPKINDQTITPDDGYDGLSSVVVKKTPITSRKTITPKSISQTINPNDGDIGLEGVIVNATPLTSQKTVTPGTTSQTINPDSGDLGIKLVIVNATPLTNQKTVTPGTSNKSIVPDNGDIGLTGVVVEGDANLVAENIKENVSIFGVVGTMKGAGVNKLNQYLNKTLIEVVPEDLEGMVEIPEPGFKNMSLLKSAIIPNSVTGALPTGCFSGCISLEKITVPRIDTLLPDINSSSSTENKYQYSFGRIFGTTAYDGGESTRQQYGDANRSYEIVFYIPTSLKEVVVLNGDLPDYAFINCRNLTKIIIPDGATQIPISAFDGCEKLENINIPNSVTSIKQYAFNNCKKLENINIPTSVISIHSSAFYSCSGIASIKVEEGNSIYYSAGNCLIDKKSKNLILGCKNSIVPEGVISIGSYAFSACTNLTTINIPDSVTSIGQSSFSFCSNLTSITIPNSVTSIGSYAFRDCIGLTSVSLSDAITKIGMFAFYSCNKLTSITIPASVSVIGIYALNIGQPSTPATIIMRPTIPPKIQEASGSNLIGDKKYIKQIIVPAGCGSAYKAATGWSNFADKIIEATE